MSKELISQDIRERALFYLSEYGVKRYWLANKVGVSSSTMYNFLNGYGTLSRAILARLNEVLESVGV